MLVIIISRIIVSFVLFQYIHQRGAYSQNHPKFQVWEYLENILLFFKIWLEYFSPSQHNIPFLECDCFNFYSRIFWSLVWNIYFIIPDQLSLSTCFIDLAIYS